MIFETEISQLHKFEGADFKYGNSFFKIPTQNDQNMAFFVHTFRHFFFCQNLPLGKFERAHLNYENLRILTFSRNFALRECRGCGFQI